MKLRKKGTKEWTDKEAHDLSQHMSVHSVTSILIEEFASDNKLKDGDIVEVEGNGEFKVRTRLDYLVTKMDK